MKFGEASILEHEPASRPGQTQAIIIAPSVLSAGAGATAIIAGSAIFGARDYAKTIPELRARAAAAVMS
jgi:hypothetical protein